MVSKGIVVESRGCRYEEKASAIICFTHKMDAESISDFVQCESGAVCWVVGVLVPVVNGWRVVDHA